MADNTELNAGTGGDVIATDDIGGVKYQRVKINYGIDGAATDVSDTNPLPIDDAGGTITVDDGGTTLSVDDGGGSITVDAASLPLPTGAATEATVATLATEATVATLATQATLSALNTKVATAKTADLDTGGGTDTVQLVGIALPASGGAVAGGSSTNPVRTDPTGTTAQPVTDNGGSLTVDGTVTANAGTGAFSGAILDGADSAIKATVLDYSNSNPVAVRLTDTNGDYVSAGGGTQYTEDAAAAGDPVGNALIARRRDSLSTETTTDGDNTALNSTGKGELYVKHVDAIPVTDNGGTLSIDDGGGTITVDGTVTVTDGSGSLTVDGTVTANAGTGTFTTGGVAAHDAAASGNPVLVAGVASAAAPTSVSADGDVVQAWLLRNGAQATVITAAGALIGGDATNGLDVDVTRVTGTVTTAEASLLADNAAFTDGTSKVLPHGFIYDEVAGTALTENDVAAARINVNRAQVGIIEDGSTRGRYATVSASNALKVDGSAVTQPVSGTVTSSNTAGDVAHDSGDSGNPVKVGGKAANALPTAVANSDRTNFVTDLWGRQLVTSIDPAMQTSKSFNATTTQTGADVWDPASGKKIAVTSIVIGTYGTTSARLILWFGDNADTTYSAGTDQLLLAASFAPSSTNKPGLALNFNPPVYCTTADRELHITTDAALSVDIAVHGFEW